MRANRSGQMGEIEAMGAIDNALGSLQADEQKRVLRWAIDKFGAGDVKLESNSGGARHGGFDDRAERNGERGEYGRISDLMDAANPTTTADHVLVASYWFQILQGQEDFTSQAVNSELKDLGRESKNITDSFNTLMKRTPPAVRQVQKSGSTRQARKKYRLTEPGIRAVQRMIRGEGGTD
jgi:hypothetical protein